MDLRDFPLQPHLIVCKDHIQPFLNYLNNQHQNIKFTGEIEVDNRLPFLGMNVFNLDSGFNTSVYRKPTFTGLYTNYDTFVPNQYKVSLINKLLHRAYMLC